jgi:hypothetical protein
LQNALVPISIPISPTEPENIVGARKAHRSSADFIAQLIAAAIKAPQTRQRRRATTDEAISLYRATGRQPAAPGRGFSRSF